MSPSSKLCSSCAEIKSTDEFWSNPRLSDGLSARCKECQSRHWAHVRENRRVAAAERLLRDGGKRCATCKLLLPVDRFIPRAIAVDGYDSYCRSCRGAKGQLYEQRHPGQKYEAEKRRRKRLGQDYLDKRNAEAKAWREANLEKARDINLRSRRVTAWAATLVSCARARSRPKGWPECDLTGEYVLSLYEQQNRRCYWLGIPLELSVETRHPLRPSLDRLVPAKGYTKGNIVIASLFANSGRSNIPPDRFRELVSRIIADIRKA